MDGILLKEGLCWELGAKSAAFLQDLLVGSSGFLHREAQQDGLRPRGLYALHQRIDILCVGLVRYPLGAAPGWRRDGLGQQTHESPLYLQWVRWPWIGIGAGFAGLYFFLAMAAFEFIVED